MAGFDPKAYLKGDDAPAFDPKAYASESEEKAPPLPTRDEYFKQTSLGDRLSNPEFWKRAVGLPHKPYYQETEIDHPAFGSPPMVAPAGTLGALGKAAVALGEGSGPGYIAGRTALSAGQGAVMSAIDGKEGESMQDKIDRAKSGAKLSGGIQLAAESLPVVGGVLGWGARRIGQAATGVDSELISNYANRTDEINKLIKQSGGNITTAADQVRWELSQGIQKAKQALNGKISTALNGASTEANIPAKSIIDKLEAAKAKLNPNYKSAAIADIDEMIQNIKSQANEEGMLSAKGLYETKQYLGGEGKGAYQKGGQIFTRANEAARAAKDAGGEARSLVKANVPEISEADAQLAKMHAIEGRLNKNLLAPGTPEGALMAAGSGANPRNAANLRTLEELSGVNVAQRAKDLATAREFASPGILPKDFTGKAAARMLLGAGIGEATDGHEGAMVGAALTSPLALKGIINVANVAGKAGRVVGIPQTAAAIRENPFLAQTAAQLGAAQLRHANDDNPMNRPAPAPAPQLIDSPVKGEAKWAQAGLKKLGIDDQETTQMLMGSKEGRSLLIEASDLPAGSKALNRIMERVRRLNNGNESITGAPSEVLRRERKPSSGR